MFNSSGAGIEAICNMTLLTTHRLHYFRPLTGTVAQTKFQIRCQHWTCPDIPIKYEFTTKKDIPASQSVSVSSLSRTDYPIWYSGYEPRNPKSILPLGDPNAGYNLTMIVRIFNAYGSFTELPPVVVQVMENPNFIPLQGLVS